MAENAKRRTLVIGGSRGIGAAIVREFTSETDEVHFTYASSEGPAAELANKTGAIAHRSDAADGTALAKLIEGSGPWNVLVYNAAALIFAPALESDLAEVDRLIDLNVRGAYIAAITAARTMPDQGRIILIGSTNGSRVPFPGIAHYAMTKSALQGLARGLSRELGDRGITVNVVQPGPTDTDMNPADAPHAPQMHGAMSIKRHGKPEEVASLVAYLAGPHGAWITGAMHTIDGGFAA